MYKDNLFRDATAGRKEKKSVLTRVKIRFSLSFIPIRFQHPPAPGYRDGGYNAMYGALGGISSEGTLWGASTHNTNGVRLYFDTRVLSPNTWHYRSYGFLLRCLSE